MSATFDNPEDSDQIILRVEVFAPGLNLLIISPQEGTAFNSREDSLPLQVVAADQLNGLSRISFQLDRGEWIRQDLHGISEISLDTTLSFENIQFPTDSLQKRVAIVMEAENTVGEVVSDSVFFLLDRDFGSNPLSTIRWDGGGDGTHWHDPLNWEGDQLPGKQQLAVVDSGFATQVVITSTGSFQEIYPVGAIDIHADVLMENKAILQIESNKIESQINGDLRFEPNSSNADEWAMIRFNDPNHSTHGGRIRLSLNGILYLGAANFDGTTPATIISPYARDLLNYPSASQAMFSNRLEVVFTNEVYQERALFFWQFKNGPHIINEGTWQMRENTAFRQDSTDFYTTHFDNNGLILVNRQMNDAQIQFGYKVWFDNRDGTWEDYGHGANIRPGSTTFFIRGHNIQNRLGNFRSSGQVYLVYGQWKLSGNVTTPLLNMGGLGSGAVPSVILNTDLPNVDFFTVQQGNLYLDKQNLYIPALDVRFSGRVTTYVPQTTDSTKIIRVDSMNMVGGSFAMKQEDTLKTKFVNWEGTDLLPRSSGDKAGTIFIQYGPFTSVLDFATRAYFYADIVIESGARLHWNSGTVNDIQSGLTGNIQDVFVRPNATFQVNSDFNNKWGYATNSFILYAMRIYNYGAVRKEGDGDVDIVGCLYNRGNGYLVEKDGSLDFVDVSCD